MALDSEPLKVYPCDDREHCPGGSPGSCASFRDPLSVGCGGCIDGAYSGGSCHSFAVRQLFALFAIPLMWLTGLLKKYGQWGKRDADLAVGVCNAVGTLYGVFFISIVLAAVDSFSCCEHPGEGSESMRSAPSLLCFGGHQYVVMITIGAIVALVSAVLFAYVFLTDNMRLTPNMAFASMPKSRHGPGRAGMARIFHMTLLLCTCQRLTAGIDVKLDPSNGNATKPVIRLAFLLEETWGSDELAGYFLKHFNVSNRTLLPDFDVLVDTWRMRSSAGEAPVAFVGMLGNDAPTYHALVGPVSSQDAIDLVPVASRAQMLQVHGASTPKLSDRTLYPYNFRVSRSAQGMQIVMFYIMQRNDWSSCITVFMDEDSLTSSTAIANQRNITTFARLAARHADDWAAEAWQNDVVAAIRAYRIRVIVADVIANPAWQLICRVHRARLSSMQWFLRDSLGPGWYLQSYPDELGDCTSAEMYNAVGGNIVSSHTTIAPGASILGAHYPFPPGDYNGHADDTNVSQAHLPLTCMPDMTAEDFFNDYDLLGFGIADGRVRDGGSAQTYISVSAVLTDALCATLLAIHDAISTKGITAASIAERSSQAFHALTQSVSQVDFDGAPGHFHFMEGTGDPFYILYAISQSALPGRSNSSFNPAAIVSFPGGIGNDGVAADPVVSESHPGLAGFLWRDGSTGLGPKAHLGWFPDCAEQRKELVWDSCEECPPGTAYDTLLRACRTCPLGMYHDGNETEVCTPAPRGWYVADVDHPSAIARCPVGYECPQAGTVSPQPCLPGRFAASAGQAECELCPAGQYQNEQGAENCTHCEGVLIGGVTTTIASTSAAECICKAGSFRPLNADYCRRCPEGMLCPLGSDMRYITSSSASDSASYSLTSPIVQPGYMTLAAAPLIVYRCEAEGQCPGGPPGTCASLRDSASIACGECVDGAYQSGEDCIDCGDAGVLPFAITCIGGIAVVIVATFLINCDVHKVTASSMMAMTVGSLLATGVQTVGVFSSLNISWEYPIKSLLKLAEVFSFNLDSLKAACVIGGAALRSFALRQLFAVCLIPFVYGTLLLKKHAPHWGKPKTDILAELCNAIGTLYSVFFISIVLSAIYPFICYRHPDGNGESVRSAPSLLCFEGGDHTNMIIIGMIAMLLVPVPFLCLCTYGVATYAHKVRTRSARFLLATRFLFMRYVPKRYYFQMIALLRSFSLCLIPAVLRDKPAPQVLVICAVLSSYVLAVDNLRPWRARVCNILDSGAGMLFIMFLVCGAIFLENASGKEAIAAIGVGILVVILLGATAAFAYALWHQCAPSYFHYFLCHHKAHAAAQARYLKILLQKRLGNAQVFIDSDNLQELDVLFDIVKSRVRHLVVLLTADTLKRPWCVGEIVTALRARIKITRLLTPSFVAPTFEQQSAPDRYVDMTGCRLEEYNIQNSDIVWALAIFLGPDIMQIELAEHLPGTRRFEHSIAALVKDRASSPRTPTLSSVKAGAVVVVTHLDSDEATASGGILVDHIASHVYNCCENGIELMCDYEQNMELSVRAARQASVAVVLLSRGCLQCITHLNIICALMRSHANGAESATHSPAVISVNTPGFDFPSPAGIKALCKAHPSLMTSYGNPSECVTSFFKRISILLPIDAAQHTINTQSEEIFRRIQEGLTSNRHSSEGSTVGQAVLKWAPNSGIVTGNRLPGSGAATLTSPASGTPSPRQSECGDDHPQHTEEEAVNAGSQTAQESTYMWSLEFL